MVRLSAILPTDFERGSRAVGVGKLVIFRRRLDAKIFQVTRFVTFFLFFSALVSNVREMRR